jgi:polygalacturonase
MLPRADRSSHRSRLFGHLAMVLTVAWCLFSGCATPKSPPLTGPQSPSAAVAGDAASKAVALSFPDDPIEPIHAPFAMASLERPHFPDLVLDVRDFGAKPDGTTKNTDAIRRTVDALVARGGGTLLVPEGRWLTGPIHLASNIRLYVAERAEILFSQDFTDYLPPVFTRWEGLELYNYSPLIYAKDCTNVAIVGPGKLDGQGKAWWSWKGTQKIAAAKAYELATSGTPVKDRVFGTVGGLRPSFIQTVGCKNVLIEGVTITNGPMWTIHPLYSENVIIRKVKVLTEGPNNDGIDPDSCRNMLIEDSSFSTGDDCIVIKSGLNEDGWRVGRPSENIVVRRVKGELGHGGVVIGSEMSGSVRNVFVDDCEFKGTDRGLRIKSMRGRGGVVENVFYQNVKHENLRLMVVELTTFYGSSTLVPRTQTPPTFRGIHIRNVTGQGAKQAMEIVGLPEAPIQNVDIENVDIASDRGLHCVDCKDIHVTAAKIAPGTGPWFELESAENVAIDRSCAKDSKDCVELSGARSRNVSVDGTATPIAKNKASMSSR